jgi:hypothetical protein
VRPVRIAAAAFPDNTPRRDLVISPDHALFIQGLLIPAKLLVNGGSITVDTECRRVTYYHVELDHHDILLAEGLPAESYLDTGNRAMFANSGEPSRLHPDFAGEQRLRETCSCAPFAADATRVAPVWRALAERSDASGWKQSDTVASVGDPDLHVLAGARRIEPLTAQDGRYVFAIPANDAPLRLMSRTGHARDARPWIDDRRLLGVLVRRMTLRSSQDVRDVAMDGPLLDRGWREAEWHAQGPCRWTGGDAVLPVLGRGVLEVILGGTMRYRIEDAVAVCDVAESALDRAG